MKYLWIAMLVLAYIFWSFKAIKDIWETVRFFKLQYVLDNLSGLTILWIVYHVIIIFGISLSMYLTE